MNIMLRLVILRNRPFNRIVEKYSKKACRLQHSCSTHSYWHYDSDKTFVNVHNKQQLLCALASLGDKQRQQLCQSRSTCEKDWVYSLQHVLTELCTIHCMTCQKCKDACMMLAYNTSSFFNDDLHRKAPPQQTSTCQGSPIHSCFLSSAVMIPPAMGPIMIFTTSLTMPPPP